MLTAAGELLTPSVTFDLSVKRESRAFIGSILEAAVSSRGDFRALELKDEHRETLSETDYTQQELQAPIGSLMQQVRSTNLSLLSAVFLDWDEAAAS